MTGVRSKTASVAAPAFSAATVAAALREPEAEVEERLDGLARAGVILVPAGAERWPDGTVAARYAFTHDLVHEVLYDDLPAGRRARLHLAIGDRLEVAHEGADHAIATELAVHFLRGGEPARALRHLVTAAERAARRLAPREALTLADTALHALGELPAAEQAPWELRLALLRGVALIATAGWGNPDAEECFVRARELAASLGQPDQIAWATYRLATLHEVRGAYARSEALLKPVIENARRLQEPGLEGDLHEVMACTLFHQGQFGDALKNAEHGVALIEGAAVDPFLATAGADPAIACHAWAALSAWHLGRPETARAISDRSIALAAEPARAHGAATALALAAVVAQCTQDVPRTRELAERAIEKAEDRGYIYWAAMGRVLRGWALAAVGRAHEGVIELRDGLALSRATGARMDDAYYLGLLADAHLRAGDRAAARAVLVEARQVVPRDGRYFHDAELHRLLGQVALLKGDEVAAEAHARTALSVARAQSARALELRAGLMLGVLLRASGRPAEAHAIVAEAYGAFSEGFGTADLRAAEAFLAGADDEPVSSAASAVR